MQSMVIKVAYLPDNPEILQQEGGHALIMVRRLTMAQWLTPC
jgi:hypothetical protein